MTAIRKGGGPWFSGLALIGVGKQAVCGATTFCFYYVDDIAGVVYYVVFMLS